MYGQTGSGKTYTMMGYNKHEDFDHFSGERKRPSYNYNNENKSATPRRFTTTFEDMGYFEPYDVGNYIITENVGNAGVLIMALKDIFESIDKDLDKTYFLRCSYIEIYNDQIYDLLKPPEKLAETLTVSEDSKRDFYIKGVTEVSVSTLEEIIDKLRKGESNRHYARTAMNHASSRSHTIFRLNVQTVTNNFIREYRRQKRQAICNINNPDLFSHQEEFENSNEIEGTMVTESLLNFVDLAGSEKVSNHHMVLDDQGIPSNMDYATNTKVKERVKEGQHINKSLFFLTQVISLKSEGKRYQTIF